MHLLYKELLCPVRHQDDKKRKVMKAWEQNWGQQKAFCLFSTRLHRQTPGSGAGNRTRRSYPSAPSQYKALPPTQEEKTL